eukprot:scaffold535255_cov19-Prasinocladus_malaysianus.AAC.1
MKPQSLRPSPDLSILCVWLPLVQSADAGDELAKSLAELRGHLVETTDATGLPGLLGAINAT